MANIKVPEIHDFANKKKIATASLKKDKGKEKLYQINYKEKFEEEQELRILAARTRDIYQDEAEKLYKENKLLKQQISILQNNIKKEKTPEQEKFDFLFALSKSNKEHKWGKTSKLENEIKRLKNEIEDLKQNLVIVKLKEEIEDLKQKLANVEQKLKDKNEWLKGLDRIVLGC